MAEFKKVITNKGQELITAAAFDSGELAVKYIVIGDANGESYEPSPEQTALVNQRNKLLITERIVNSPTRYTFLVQIPQDIDYYIIREIGLVDENDNLIEIAQMEQETYIQSDNLVQQLTIGIQIDVGQSSTVIVLADTNIETASKDFVNNNFQNLNQKGQANGYCGLNNNSQIPSVNIPNITNCIIETPQNLIWEEITNGVRLKAGSKITVPNGFESNGTTLKFDEILISEDLDYTYTGSTTAIHFLVYRTDTNAINAPRVSAAISGDTAPTGTGIWYDSTTNKVKYYSGGTLSFDDASLPLGVFNCDTKKLIQSFNHIGFIGTAVFFHKGIKILSADGRNSDGTLKNKITILSNARIGMGGWSGTNNHIRFNTESQGVAWIRQERTYKVNSVGELPTPTSNTLHLAYVSDENKWYYFYITGGVSEWTECKYIFFGAGKLDSGQTYFESMQIPEILSVMDMNNPVIPNIDGQWVRQSYSICSDFTSPTTDVEFDLSGYLPDDGYNYEVLFTGYGQTGTTSGSIMRLTIVTTYGSAYLVYIRTRTTSLVNGAGSATLVVGADRKVSLIGHTGNSGNVNLVATAYRRLGTNS